MVDVCVRRCRRHHHCACERLCGDCHGVRGGGGAVLFGTRAQNGSTALILTAQRGHADCARLLIDAGADANVKDEVRSSVLFVYRYACFILMRFLA
jgi:hypothetical protein